MDENFKIIFGELSERKRLIEKKLVKNVLGQIIAITIGLSYVFNFDLGLTVKEIQGVKVEYKAIAEVLKVVIPWALLYFFIEFGFSIGLFFHLHKSFKKAYEKILDNYCGTYDSRDKHDLRISFNALSIFEQLSGNKTSGRGTFQVVLASIVIAVIILANHFTAYKTLELADNNRVALKSVLSVALIIFYLLYNSGNAKERYSPKFLTWAITTGFVVIAIYFFLDECIPGLKFSFEKIQTGTNYSVPCENLIP